MSRIRIYARNLATNWVGYGTNVAVAFFLTPFIVHSLGDIRYGIWSLVMSLVGYLGLADMGVRPS
ncbi:MAG: polysaccharide biosynthesis protein, partial [Proteobacteria bacterium]|nr:polysaccharide biosynthesis protein [Pseudomonadota bacterium]